MNAWIASKDANGLASKLRGQVRRERPKTALPRSRQTPLDKKNQRETTDTSLSRSMRRPGTAPAGRRQQTAMEKKYDLASKQGRLMKLMIVESDRLKNTIGRIEKTKAKIMRVRRQLKEMAKGKYIDARFACENLRKKEAKQIAMKEAELKDLKIKRSKIELENIAEKQKCDHLRKMSIKLEHSFNCTRAEYLRVQNELKTVMLRAEETHLAIESTKQEMQQEIQKDEEEEDLFDRQMRHQKMLIDNLVLSEKLAQEKELNAVLKPNAEPEQKKKTGFALGGLFNKSLSASLGSLLGKSRKNSIASSSFSGVTSPAGKTRLRLRKFYPPADPMAIYNQFLKLVRAREDKFSLNDVAAIRRHGKKPGGIEEIRLSQQFVHTLESMIGEEDRKTVIELKSLQNLKEEVEWERMNFKQARADLEAFVKEHNANNSAWRMKVEQLRNTLKGLMGLKDKEKMKCDMMGDHVNQISNMILRLLKDMSTSSHLKEKAKLEQFKKKQGKLQLTQDQLEEQNLWERLEIRKANNEPPLLKETIRGMEILECHIYDLLDIVATQRPGLLKDPSSVFINGVGEPMTVNIGKVPGARGKLARSPLSITTTRKRGSYFGPPSPSRYDAASDRVSMSDVEKLETLSLPAHSSNILSLNDLRRQMETSNVKDLPPCVLAISHDSIFPSDSSHKSGVTSR
jgi:hypothetical protein